MMHNLSILQHTPTGRQRVRPAMFVLAAVLMITVFASFALLTAEAVSSPKKQMDSGVAPQDVLCVRDLVLVIRDDGRAACIKESTATKLGLEIVAIGQIEPEPDEPLESYSDIDGINKISSQEDLESVLEMSTMFGHMQDRMFEVRERVTVEVAVPETQDRSLVARSGGGGAGTILSEPSMISEAPMPTVDTQTYGGSDYTTTNIQIEGVDEPDYLKNDSKYVYIVSGNTLSIIDAYPAKDAKLVLKIALDVESQDIRNMFLNDNRLVIFYSGQSTKEIIPQYDFVPHRSYEQVTHAMIVDVTDKENPEILKNYSIDGHFRDARMIGDYAYFVTNSNVDYQHPRLPVILEGSDPVLFPNAFYFDNEETLSNFNILTSIDIFGDTIQSEAFLMGYSGTFYVSNDSFYLTYLQDVSWHEDTPYDRFFDVIVPLLPQNIQSDILEIRDDSTANQHIQWLEISTILQDLYDKMSEDDIDELFDNIDDALAEYDRTIQQDSTETIIHKISIKNGEIKYDANGSVPGRLLNQFSMDQNGDRFRVATTVEYYTQSEGYVTANSVHILDEKMNTVGSLENIAPDELIFSARFVGDRLYLVTFKQIDPFFVIDLSGNTPKILGELKIPGFSDYLHPYDEDHIIGIGRDTEVARGGAVLPLGIKIALFDVSDVNNPIVADGVIIGDKSARSEALGDHKSFFFDSNSGILSIPISGEWTGTGLVDLPESDSKDIRVTSPQQLRNDYWDGFYVFNLDTDGFDFIDRIAHQYVDSSYWEVDPRTFRIDDVLYTIYYSDLKMSSIKDLDEINSIWLENVRHRVYWETSNDMITLYVATSTDDGEPYVYLRTPDSGTITAKVSDFQPYLGKILYEAEISASNSFAQVYVDGVSRFILLDTPDGGSRPILLD